MSIIVSRSGKNAVRLERAVIQKEDYLQKYIYDNPESLPLHEIKEGLRLLILTREFSVTSGYIDALGVDAEGNIYVIETKLYKNPDKRLVIAQMLDYGASLWQSYADPGLFLEQLEQDVTKAFGMGLEQKLSQTYGFEAEAMTDYRDLLKENIKNGAFRFVVLMDEIDDRLKELISFVNANSRFHVLGVELEFYEHEGSEIIIPRLFGAEQRKTVEAGTRSRLPWAEEKFFTELDARREPVETQVIRRLYEWIHQRNLNVWWGSGARTGSFSPLLSHQGQDYYLFIAYTYASVEMNFGMLSGRAAFQAWDTRQELVRRLNAVPGIALVDRAGNTPIVETRTTIARAAGLASNHATEKLIEVFDWMVEVIRKS